MKTKTLLVALLLTGFVWSSCKKNPLGSELPKPTATNIEVGTSNNKRGIIGADFHLNADILAGDKIALVKVLIAQKPTETYASAWKLELSWESYAGAKNTNVHRHFTIPADAPKGAYDFYLIVTDQNGTKLEIREDFSLVAASDLPFNPSFTFRNVPAEDQVYKKGDVLTSRFGVNDVKDEGTLSAVLIKSSAKHYPETVSQIDFTRAINVGTFVADTSPSWGMFTTITIGAEKDLSFPENQPITGAKAWESGKYNFVMFYENKVHKISIYKSVPIVIDYQ